MFNKKERNIILGIDTTNQNLSLAISEQGKILIYDEKLFTQNHSKNIIFMIEKSLQSTNLEYKDLDYLALTVGPGGFTGLRIALSIAKVLSSVTKVKILPLSNFEVHAYRASNQVKAFDKNVVVLKSSKNKFAIEIFSSNDSKIFSQIVLEQELHVFFKILSNQKEIIILSGNALYSFWQALHKHPTLATEHLVLLPRFPYVRALHLCELSYIKLVSDQRFLDLEPIYYL